MSIFDTFLNWKVFVQTLPLLLSGLTTTLTLGITAHHPRLHRGAGARARVGSTAPRRFGSLPSLYIDVFRSIPILVLLVVIYYALPFVGIRLSPFGAAA